MTEPLDEHYPRQFNNATEPAFPVPEGSMNNVSPGMTKREYFAAMAMHGMISANYGRDGMGVWGVDQISKTALLYADELLKALEK